MLQFEKTMARVLLLNAGLTMLVVFGFIGPPQQTNEFIVLLATGLLGVISAVLAMRGRIIGWWGGLIFYGLQLFSYYPYGDGWGYAVKAGVSFSGLPLQSRRLPGQFDRLAVCAGHRLPAAPSCKKGARHTGRAPLINTAHH